MVQATGKSMSSVVKVPVWFTALSEIYESSKSNIFDNSGLFLESPTVIQLPVLGRQVGKVSFDKLSLGQMSWNHKPTFY